MLRLRQVALVAHQLGPVVDDLTAVFAVAVAYRDPGVATFGLENAVLPFGEQFVEVVAPVREGTAGGRYLERRGGDGGYMVILQCDDHPPLKARLEALGVRTVVDHDEDGYSILQLHPRDTGGSFLEVDVQAGGEDLLGPWMPAGPQWQQARRVERVVGLVAVEVQSPAPEPLAERWSAILDRPVVPGADGPELALDNASVRFVPDRDGRGEGLGAVHVALASGAAPAVQAAAEARGLWQGDHVLLGGVRFHLAS